MKKYSKYRIRKKEGYVVFVDVRSQSLRIVKKTIQKIDKRLKKIEKNNKPVSSLVQIVNKSINKKIQSLKDSFNSKIETIKSNFKERFEELSLEHRSIKLDVKNILRIHNNDMREQTKEISKINRSVVRNSAKISKIKEYSAL